MDSNYDTDIFWPLFEAIQRVTGAPAYTGKVGTEDVNHIDTAYRVVADHIRTLCFAITDGALPSNKRRGYVLRRVLRRAVLYGREYLDASEGFLASLVPSVVHVMSEAYPELKEKQEHVSSIIMDEEKCFLRVLQKGRQKFDQLVEKNVGPDRVFSAEDAHFLHTTIGFPVYLTELLADKNGLTLDKDSFQAMLDRERAK